MASERTVLGEGDGEAFEGLVHGDFHGVLEAARGDHELPAGDVWSERVAGGGHGSSGRRQARGTDTGMRPAEVVSRLSRGGGRSAGLVKRSVDPRRWGAW